LTTICRFDHIPANKSMHTHGRREGAGGGSVPIMDFEILSKRGCFLSFEREK